MLVELKDMNREKRVNESDREVTNTSQLDCLDNAYYDNCGDFNWIHPSLIIYKNLCGSNLSQAQGYSSYNSTKLGNCRLRLMSKDTLIGFLMVISCSLICPLTNLLPAKDTYVKLAWRIQGCAAIFLCFSLIMHLRYPATYISIRKDFYLKNILSTAFLAIFFLTWSAGYIIGSSFIVTSHAVIINSSSCFWISIVTCLVFRKINVLEIYGLLFYLAGFSIILSDSSATDLQRNTNQYKGYLYTFLGAGSCAIFSYLNYIIKLEIYPIIKLLQLYIFSFIFLMICSPFLSCSENFISFDPEFGVFGWIHNWSTIMIVFINSLITGIISIICFLDYSENYSICVISCVMLLEPFIAQISGIILGKDEFFGACTILGLGIASVSLFVFGNGYVDFHKNIN